MIRQSFNDAWRFGPFVSVHEAIVVAGPGQEVVTLPHDAMLARGRAAEHSGGPQTGYFRDGKWTYEKQFDVPDEWTTKRVTFEFEGVYRDAMVYLNGALAGQWANGYSRFHVSADPFLKYGADQHDPGGRPGPGRLPLVLRRRHPPSRPPARRRPRPRHPQRPAGDHPGHRRRSRHRRRVDAEIVNEDIPTRTVEVLLEIRDADGEVVASDRSRVTLLAGEAATTHQRAYVRSPSLWSVDSPHLYHATVRLFDDSGDIDDSTTTFGIRTVTADPMRGLRINGETVKLRGAAVHHDNGVLGAADFADAAERRVRMLKDAASTPSAPPTTR